MRNVGPILIAIRGLYIDTVLTDSRSMCEPSKSVFFALRTATNDGHNYIPELAERGVCLFVVDHVPEGVAGQFIVVEDTLMALQQLASEWRGLINSTVVAVVGSRGKTIVKEWLAEALAAKGSVARSPRSWNSQLGVAKSILTFRGEDFVVVEAGVSKRGEMERLEAMIDPDVVVLTGIDPAEHSEGFSSYAEKCKEKLRMAKNPRAIIYPSELDDYVAEHVGPYVMKISVAMPQDADWMERDRLLTVETLRYLGAQLPDGVVRQLFTRLDTSEGVNNCSIITDRFTCDLFSLESALDFAHRRKPEGRRLTLILDQLRDSNEVPQIPSGVDRLIYVGKGGLTPQEFLSQYSVSDFSNEVILAKGEIGGPVATFAEQLQARHHETVLEVNLDAVVHNYNHFRALLKPETGIVAMVKASGYGAGAFELAKTLQSQGAAYLAVAVVDEGEELRRAGITMPIMALNPKVTNYDSLFANHLEPEVFSFEMLDEIIREGSKRGVCEYPIHVKFDTGMHRLGFVENDVAELCGKLAETNVVRVESVFSHLATADCLDMDQYTLSQLDAFSRICERMRSKLDYAFKRHVLNSAGIARFPEYQFEMVRLGISLYGVDTIGVQETQGLRTVSTLRSIIISLKDWPEGTSIGYARRTILSRPSKVATVPVGYADGLDRRLGNGVGRVWLKGVLCPVLGNVCMDACMIDVTDVPDVAVGDSVEFFGENLPVSSVSDSLSTIPYEVLTSVSPRVKRVYYRE